MAIGIVQTQFKVEKVEMAEEVENSTTSTIYYKCTNDLRAALNDAKSLVNEPVRM